MPERDQITTAKSTYPEAIIDAATTGWYRLLVTDDNAVVLPAPLNPPAEGETQQLGVEIQNLSGGEMGPIVWDPVFEFAGRPWENPAHMLRRYALFQWNGSAWICLFVAAADYDPGVFPR